MDRFDEEMSDLSSSEVVSWEDAAAFGRRNYAEGLAAGVAEGEAKMLERSKQNAITADQWKRVAKEAKAKLKAAREELAKLRMDAR